LIAKSNHHHDVSLIHLGILSNAVAVDLRLVHNDLAQNISAHDATHLIDLAHSHHFSNAKITSEARSRGACSKLFSMYHAKSFPTSLNVLSHAINSLVVCAASNVLCPMSFQYQTTLSIGLVDALSIQDMNVGMFLSRLPHSIAIFGHSSHTHSILSASVLCDSLM